MFVDQIKARLQNGFQPFVLRLSDGREFKIPHRDFVAVSPGVVVVIDEKDISRTINPVHIVSIGESTHK